MKKIAIKIFTFILSASSPFIKNHIFIMRHGLAKGFKRRFGLGFKPKFSLSSEERFLKTFNLKGKIIFDVGAYIGLYSLFFSRKAGGKGAVFSFEPNPQNHEEAVFNIKVNNVQNVTIMPVGIGKEYKEMDFVIDPVYPTRGTFEESRKRNILKTRGAQVIKVKVFGIDTLIEQKSIPEPNFIKIDVEGLEMDVLEGMEQLADSAHPELFIELHRAAISKKVIKWLISKDYSIYHVEKISYISNDKHEIDKGHFFCKPLLMVP